MTEEDPVLGAIAVEVLDRDMVGTTVKLKRDPGPLPEHVDLVAVQPLVVERHGQPGVAALVHLKPRLQPRPAVLAAREVAAQGGAGEPRAGATGVGVDGRGERREIELPGAERLADEALDLPRSLIRGEVDDDPRDGCHEQSVVQTRL